MREVVVSDTYLQDIADAIRAQNGMGSSDTISPMQMAALIRNIQGSPIAGFIDVYYVAGTTVTIAKDNVSLSSDQTGHYCFAVPSAGTWTLSQSITDSSFNVSIAYGQRVSKNLAWLPYSEFDTIASVDAASYTGDYAYCGFACDAGSSNTDHVDSGHIVCNNNIYIDYGSYAGGTNSTAYLVIEPQNTSLQRILTVSSTKNPSNPDVACFFGNGNDLKIYDGGDVSLGTTLTQKHVLSISYNKASGAVGYFKNGVKVRSSTKSPLGNYININGTSNGSSNSYRATQHLYYAAVVAGADTDANVIANQQSLMTKFGMS